MDLKIDLYLFVFLLSHRFEMVNLWSFKFSSLSFFAHLQLILWSHKVSWEIYNSSKCHKSDLRGPLHGIFGNSILLFWPTI